MRRLSILATMISLSFHSQASGVKDWVSSWKDNAVGSYQETPASSFQGSSRNYRTGYGLSVRYKTKTDSLMTITTPRLKFGCGGIDMFMGGFSFLDADYLVDKMQSMVTVAPYIAVDMALKSMSKEMSDSLNTAEDLINNLNNIQIDECQGAKPIVAMAFGESSEGVTNTWSEMLNTEAISSNATKLWNETNQLIADNSGKVDASLQISSSVISGCPTQLKEIYQEGSVVDNILSQYGMDSYAPLVRGIFGDVSIEKQDSLLIGKFIPACDGNAVNSQLLTSAGTQIRNTVSSSCTTDTSSFKDEVEAEITQIANAIDNQTDLTSDQKKFVSFTQLPMIPILSNATELGQKAGDQTMLINELAQLVTAKNAQQMTATFYNSIKLAIVEANKVHQQESTNSGTCQINYYISPANKTKELLADVHEKTRTLNSDLQTDINTMVQTQLYLDALYKAQRDANKKHQQRTSNK